MLLSVHFLEDAFTRRSRFSSHFWPWDYGYIFIRYRRRLRTHYYCVVCSLCVLFNSFFHDAPWVRSHELSSAKRGSLATSWQELSGALYPCGKGFGRRSPRALSYGNKSPFKKFTNGRAMCILKHLYPFGFWQHLSLVEVRVAAKAQGRNTVIMRFKSSTFTISKLVTMCGNDCSVL